jgi:hypothetical protein
MLSSPNIMEKKNKRQRSSLLIALFGLDGKQKEVNLSQLNMTLEKHILLIKESARVVSEHSLSLRNELNIEICRHTNQRVNRFLSGQFPDPICLQEISSNFPERLTRAFCLFGPLDTWSIETVISQMLWPSNSKISQSSSKTNCTFKYFEYTDQEDYVTAKSSNKKRKRSVN